MKTKLLTITAMLAMMAALGIGPDGSGNPGPTCPPGQKCNVNAPVMKADGSGNPPANCPPGQKCAAGTKTSK